ncbi:MAG: master regulator for biofilm formation [Bacillaceae bacterium G1]|mgnify:CR=1 FL=1|nr:master regulator for biofilm formation [Bacillota bacterium]OJF16623.1 MAG: master regulator for biofilm formation [Bacillaceae bacterium G1]
MNSGETAATRTVTKKEIMDKARELADLIAQSEEVEFYRRAEQQIKRSQKVQSLIAQLKRTQKELVHAKQLQKHQLAAQLEEKLERLQDELDEIPIVVEFKESQLEINDLLQLVTNVISNTITEKIILSTGGNLLTGETGLMPLDDEEKN